MEFISTEIFLCVFVETKGSKEDGGKKRDKNGGGRDSERWIRFRVSHVTLLCGAVTPSVQSPPASTDSQLAPVTSQKLF